MATVIPKQLKKQRDQITIRLDREVIESLEHYCRYLESARDYVINQCLAFIFRKDKAFQLWLAGEKRDSAANAESSTAKSTNARAKNGAVQGRLSISELIVKHATSDR